MEREEEWWAAPLGAAIFVGLVLSVSLTAIAGWNWFAAFLSGQAANWVQAIGSIVAILAAYQMGRTQIAADRILEGTRLAKEDYRKLTVIVALVENLEFHIDHLAAGINRFKIPTASLCSIGHLQDACATIKSIELLSCPSVDVVPQLAMLPRYCDGMFDAILSYDNSFDDPHGDVDRQHRGLQNSIRTASFAARTTKDSCLKAIESLVKENCGR